MTTNLLSLCCGAHPAHGVINERFGHHTGYCSLCQRHTTFGPGGVVEGQPAWLRLPPLTPQGEREGQLKRIERRASWAALGADLLGLFALLLCLVGVVWGVWHWAGPGGGAQGGQGGSEGVGQQRGGSVHDHYPTNIVADLQ